MAVWSWETHENEAREAAIGALRQDGLIAIPTETFYALAILPGREKAAQRLRAASRHISSQPLTLAMRDRREVERGGFLLGAKAKALADRYWPGPLSLELPDSEGHSALITCPGSVVPQSLMLALDSSLVLVSCPYSEPSALENFPAQVDEIIETGPTPIRQARTHVRLGTRGIDILSEGIITKDMVFAVAGTFVLFVCTGNTCRSPMAEALTRGMLAKRLGIENEKLEDHGFRVESAGVAAYPGMTVSPEAVDAVDAMGFSLPRSKTSNPLDSEMVESATHIFTLTQSHLSHLIERFPNSEGKAQPLHREGKSIADPIGGPAQVYASCAAEIAKQLDPIIDEILSDQGPLSSAPLNSAPEFGP